ncbi:Cdc7p-Dbf4p kinase complex regulatory subunit [Batrachochytrium dendrobatidis]|nr:Cdc7p-Dbf4p kinase complex regulatory subunit [Batrachochytrium dendrobatidis]
MSSNKRAGASVPSHCVMNSNHYRMSMFASSVSGTPTADLYSQMQPSPCSPALSQHLNAESTPGSGFDIVSRRMDLNSDNIAALDASTTNIATILDTATSNKDTSQCHSPTNSMLSSPVQPNTKTPTAFSVSSCRSFDPAIHSPLALMETASTPVKKSGHAASLSTAASSIKHIHKIPLSATPSTLIGVKRSSSIFTSINTSEKTQLTSTRIRPPQTPLNRSGNGPHSPTFGLSHETDSNSKTDRFTHQICEYSNMASLSVTGESLAPKKRRLVSDSHPSLAPLPTTAIKSLQPPIFATPRTPANTLNSNTTSGVGTESTHLTPCTLRGGSMLANITNAQLSKSSLRSTKPRLSATPSTHAPSNLNSTAHISNSHSLLAQSNQKQPLDSSVALQRSATKFQGPSQNKIAAWRARFKTFSFYLDGFEPRLASRVSKQIKALGANIVSFLSTSVTHLVTVNEASIVESLSNQSPGGLAKNTKSQLLLGKKSTMQDPVQRARKLGTKVWPFSKLNAIITFLLPEVLLGGGLADVLHKEKMYGVSTRGNTDKPKVMFKPFKGPFVLVEDLFDQYRPVVAHEFPEQFDPESPPWPIIHFDRPSSKSVFIARRSSSARNSVDDESNKNDDEKCKEDDAIYTGTVLEGKQSIRRDADNTRSPFDAVAASIASGLISGSVANLANKQNLHNDPRIARLGLRVLNHEKVQGGTSKQPSSPLKQRVVSNNQPSQSQHKASAPQQYSTTSRPRLVGMMFYTRPGFCENCNVKYDQFQVHVKSKMHLAWAANEQNFRVIDGIIGKLKRVELRHLIDPFEPFEISRHEDIDCYDEEGPNCLEQITITDSVDQTDAGRSSEAFKPICIDFGNIADSHGTNMDSDSCTPSMPVTMQTIQVSNLQQLGDALTMPEPLLVNTRKVLADDNVLISPSIAAQGTTQISLKDSLGQFFLPSQSHTKPGISPSLILDEAKPIILPHSIDEPLSSLKPEKASTILTPNLYDLTTSKAADESSTLAVTPMRINTTGSKMAQRTYTDHSYTRTAQKSILSHPHPLLSHNSIFDMNQITQTQGTISKKCTDVRLISNLQDVPYTCDIVEDATESRSSPQTPMSKIRLVYDLSGTSNTSTVSYLHTAPTPTHTPAALSLSAHQLVATPMSDLTLGHDQGMTSALTSQFQSGFSTTLTHMTAVNIPAPSGAAASSAGKIMELCDQNTDDIHSGPYSSSNESMLGTDTPIAKRVCEMDMLQARSVSRMLIFNPNDDETDTESKQVKTVETMTPNKGDLKGTVEGESKQDVLHQKEVDAKANSLASGSSNGKMCAEMITPCVLETMTSHTPRMGASCHQLTTQSPSNSPSRSGLSWKSAVKTSSRSILDPFLPCHGMTTARAKSSASKYPKVAKTIGRPSRPPRVLSSRELNKNAQSGLQ